MEELVRYLLKNIYIDFQGDIDLKTVMGYLSTDPSAEAETLRRKLKEDGDVGELLLTLADVLKPFTIKGINDRVLREQINEYANS